MDLPQVSGQQQVGGGAENRQAGRDRVLFAGRRVDLRLEEATRAVQQDAEELRLVLLSIGVCLLDTSVRQQAQGDLRQHRL